MQDLDREWSGIAAGDTDAFARWVAGAEPVVRRSLRPFAAVVDAEAVLQESLLRTWQVAARFVSDGRPNGLLRLSLRIARNLAISERRRARTVASGDETLEEAFERDLQALERPPGDPMLRQVIVECRDALPEKPRAALSARLEAAGAEPDGVLAESLGMRKNTFLQNFTRARKLLVECLERHGVDLRMELA
jgi:DNA-directed RNA polymerase specialized sigma24 family protein